MTGFTNFEELERRSSPNFYIVAPARITDAADEAAIIEQPAAEVFEKLQSFIQSQPNWKITALNKNEQQLKFVATSKLMRFKDDIDVAVLEDGEDSSDILIYSRSRVGYSDMGANRKRAQRLISAVR